MNEDRKAELAQISLEARHNVQIAVANAGTGSKLRTHELEMMAHINVPHKQDICMVLGGRYLHMNTAVS